MQQMRRVAVVGCGGSGKSYVARELGRLLGAPVTHLDGIFFDDEWNSLPPGKFEAAQREVVAARSWVVDGNYNSTLRVRLDACDTVVFMDVPTWAALWGIVSRQFRHGAGQHSAGVYNRINVAVLRYVATYRRRMRPQVLTKIHEHGGHATVIRLTSRRRTRRWLEQVAAQRT
ncbi:topology modulation protein [Planotetraspora silvatica]|uniref:Topology modulation protein n=1 Tax=Planotetraspora silvatica TaxID=234614 RepID=A0A8J3XK54_9ACTN|nr:topology modulation protein [Planotetraspora silvatica]GII44119.1 topology modulation protein [Planotetraspora silvatica]